MRSHLRALLSVPAAVLIISASPVHAETDAFPPETEAALQAIVDKHQAKTGAPGVLVGVWVPGRGTFVRAQGLGDVSSQRPLRDADAVRIGSITKTFVATAVLRLVDDGRPSLDDHLERFVPGIPNGAQDYDSPVARHALGHR